MKTCPTCRKEKDDSEFPKRGSKCIECQSMYLETRSLSKEVVELPSDERWPKTKDGRLKYALELRMNFYKTEALEAMFDLAMIDMALVEKNSTLGQIKFAAASKLAGVLPGESSAPGTPLDNVLKELNERFHSTAPRIKRIREITFEDSPQEQIIESSPTPAE